MNWFELFFGTKDALDDQTATSAGVRLPLHKDVARQLTGFDFKKQWTCECGKNLAIRSRESRDDGPSNFKAKANGHATLAAVDLNWDGLAEERGWITTPAIVCPKCQAGS